MLPVILTEIPPIIIPKLLSFHENPVKLSFMAENYLVEK